MKTWGGERRELLTWRFHSQAWCPGSKQSRQDKAVNIKGNKVFNIKTTEAFLPLMESQGLLNCKQQLHPSFGWDDVVW